MKKKDNGFILIEYTQLKKAISIFVIHLLFMVIGCSDYVLNIKEESILIGLFLNILYQLLSSILIFIFLKNYLKEMWTMMQTDDFGIRVSKTVKGLLIVLLINMMYRACILFFKIGGNISVNQKNVVEYATNYPLITLFLCVVLGSFTEEVIYRGVLFQIFKKKGSMCAIICSSIIFGIMHILSSLGNSDTLQSVLVLLGTYVVGGIALGSVYNKYKNLWINITIHAIWNFIGTLLVIVK